MNEKIVWVTGEEVRRDKRRTLIKIFFSFVLFAVSVYLLFTTGMIK